LAVSPEWDRWKEAQRRLELREEAEWQREREALKAARKAERERLEAKAAAGREAAFLVVRKRFGAKEA